MIVVKIGGKVVEDQQKLHKFCEAFARLQGPKVLVHGGGVMASQLQKDLGQVPQMIAGRRVTDADTLRIVTMVYAGWCNKNIVATLQACGCNAIGLSGCDGATITASKRPPISVTCVNSATPSSDSEETTIVDYGFVGDVTAASVNVDAIDRLINSGFTPVFCAINHDARGNLLNTNADTVAASLSSALHARLLYCFEKDGVLREDASVIPHITPAYFEQLKAQGIVADGMIPKLENSFAALRNGTLEVVIKNADKLLSDEGTVLELT